jgi:hypothetical protein
MKEVENKRRRPSMMKSVLLPLAHRQKQDHARQLWRFISTRLHVDCKRTLGTASQGGNTHSLALRIFYRCPHYSIKLKLLPSINKLQASSSSQSIDHRQADQPINDQDQGTESQEEMLHVAWSVSYCSTVLILSSGKT